MVIYLILSMLCNVFALAQEPVAVSPSKEVAVQEEEPLLFEEEVECDELEEEGETP